MECTASQMGRINTENLLDRGCRDFSAAYMEVKYLASHVQKHPETITLRTIDVLAGILESRQFDRQKQVLFLYIEAADAMVQMACRTQSPIAGPIIPRLLIILSQAGGKCLRALSQSLGSLPVHLSNPSSVDQIYLGFAPETKHLPLDITLDDLTGGYRETAWQGRSLVVKTKDQNEVVIKFAVSGDNIVELVREILWMKFLNQNNSDSEILLPSPLKIREKILFKITGTLPGGGPDELMEGICIAFFPCPGYYDYPNEGTGRWSRDRIRSVFFKNARFLGQMARMGIFHTALIPLFHNRAQQGRRTDSGAYLWEHGGRLDQWLDSCRYPNFAASGPRDFEHLIAAKNSRQLGHYIGEHLLSFILVMGSYFRNQAPLRRGLDENNVPCDTRDLFSQDLFGELMDGVCRSYFQGLVGAPCPPDIDLSPRSLIEALVLAMGQDVHMEEILRVRDQEEMGNHQFKIFLKERGITRLIVRGSENIVIDTGPHLGGFNQPISVPQLIDHLFRFSALCTAACFLSGSNHA